VKAWGYFSLSEGVQRIPCHNRHIRKGANLAGLGEPFRFSQVKLVPGSPLEGTRGTMLICLARRMRAFSQYGLEMVRQSRWRRSSGRRLIGLTGTDSRCIIRVCLDCTVNWVGSGRLHVLQQKFGIGQALGIAIQNMFSIGTQNG
jgi:hypothetical protein